MCLLALSPMGDELQLDTQQHYDFLCYVVEVYGKSWQNVVYLVGDNVSTNKNLSDKYRIALIGCCSHRFNLAVMDILSAENDTVLKVNTIMIKLRSLQLSA